MSRRWKENTLRNQKLTAGGRIMSQPYGKLRSWNACLHLTQGVAWKVSNETWNYMKRAWFCTALQLWKSRPISQNRPQKACRKAVWCHDSFSQQRPELHVQRLEAVWLCSLGAGHHTAALQSLSWEALLIDHSAVCSCPKKSWNRSLQLDKNTE